MILNLSCWEGVESCHFCQNLLKKSAKGLEFRWNLRREVTFSMHLSWTNTYQIDQYLCDFLFKMSLNLIVMLNILLFYNLFPFASPGNPEMGKNVNMEKNGVDPPMYSTVNTRDI